MPVGNQQHVNQVQENGENSDAPWYHGTDKVSPRGSLQQTHLTTTLPLNGWAKLPKESRHPYGEHLEEDSPKRTTTRPQGSSLSGMYWSTFANYTIPALSTHSSAHSSGQQITVHSKLLRWQDRMDRMDTQETPIWADRKEMAILIIARQQQQQLQALICGGQVQMQRQEEIPLDPGINMMSGRAIRWTSVPSMHWPCITPQVQSAAGGGWLNVAVGLNLQSEEYSGWPDVHGLHSFIFVYWDNQRWQNTSTLHSKDKKITIIDCFTVTVFLYK